SSVYNDPLTTYVYTLSLHDALPILGVYALSPTQVFVVGAFGTLLSTSDGGRSWRKHDLKWDKLIERIVKEGGYVEPNLNAVYFRDRKSTRLNSSHVAISYAVFCLKK